MMKLFSRRAIALCLSLVMATVLITPALVLGATAPANPSSDTINYGLGDTGGFSGPSGVGGVGLSKKSDLKGIVVNIINLVLGFLGIIAVIIILAGGFKWMTAAGNEDKVGEARKMIIQGVVGLIIIFLAWGIASFVISQLKDVSDVTT